MDAESQVRKVGLPPLAAAYTSEKFQEEVSRRRFKKKIQEEDSRRTFRRRFQVRKVDLTPPRGCTWKKILGREGGLAPATFIRDIVQAVARKWSNRNLPTTFRNWREPRLNGQRKWREKRMQSKAGEAGASPPSLPGIFFHV